MKKEPNSPKSNHGNTENETNNEISEGFISVEDHASLILAIEKEYTKWEERIQIELTKGGVSWQALSGAKWLACVLRRLKKPITRNLAERIMYECHVKYAGSLRSKAPQAQCTREFNLHQWKLVEKFDSVSAKISTTKLGEAVLFFNLIPLEFEEEYDDVRFQLIESGTSRYAIGNWDEINASGDY